MEVPFFRPDLSQAEIDEVVATLRSGWLTSGPRARRFEDDFALAVDAEHAVSLNSCTAALHLALEALEVEAGDVVLVPTNTFAATAEVVRYFGAHPLLVDCEETTSNVSFEDADLKIQRLRQGRLPIPKDAPVVGMIPVHVGGFMVDFDALSEFAGRHDLWIVEDSAHAFPAAWRRGGDSPWLHWGRGITKVACYSFYANKTITTGEGGMAVTDDLRLAERIRRMSLHGLSNDAWRRFESRASWDYKIVAPGYKYNLTDIAAAIGIHQLRRAEQMRLDRERVAEIYREHWRDLHLVELPVNSSNRIHSWHLFPIRLQLTRLEVDRNKLMERLADRGIKTSVHWRPLHLHPYYEELGWRAEDCPKSTATWTRLISMPIFSGITSAEIEHVVTQLADVCREYSIDSKTLA